MSTKQSYFISINEFRIFQDRLVPGQGIQIKIDDFQVALFRTRLTDNVEGSQNVINSMVAWKQLHFTSCVLLAFAGTADKNNQ